MHLLRRFRSCFPRRLWARGRLDIGWDDLLFAFGAPWLPGPLPRRVWPTEKAHIALLSVRTAWDALLCVQKWPPGSEIILSEANIPGMVRLIELHGLVPVPVPISPRTLAVEAEAVEAAITERTKAILVSPLFGSRMDLQEVAKMACRHNLLLVEDNAQGFSDASFQGSPEADVSLFSFGLIKTRTALGGAVVFARDAQLLEAMERQVHRYPQVSTGEFYRKLVRAVALQGLSQPFLFGFFWGVLEKRGVNPDVWLSQMTRGFSGRELLTTIRQRPHRGTLKLLRRRLRESNDTRTHWRIERGQEALRLLPSALGREAQFPFFWALALVTRDKEAFVQRAREARFDVSFRASSLACHSPIETEFSRALEQAVFLPIGNSMPENEWKRLMQIAQDACDKDEDSHVALSGSVEGGGASSARLAATLEL